MKTIPAFLCLFCLVLPLTSGYSNERETTRPVLVPNKNRPLLGLLLPRNRRVNVFRNFPVKKKLDVSEAKTLEELENGLVVQTDSSEKERMVLSIKDVEYAFRWCPAGTFMMGSPQDEPGRSVNETLHQVKLTGFWMLETEVTQMMWASVMGNNPSHFEGMKCPVEQVSWNDCQEYIKKLNELLAGTLGTPAGFKFSLPTEAQWEYACRAGTTTAFHFGSHLEQEQANFGGNSKKTSEVGSYPANAWGLYDCHGNVLEWCLDWYGDYPSGAVTDPMGAAGGSYHVLRGGYWGDVAERCESADRSFFYPSDWYSCVGLRVSLVSSDK